MSTLTARAPLVRTHQKVKSEGLQLTLNRALRTTADHTKDKEIAYAKGGPKTYDKGGLRSYDKGIL